MDNPLNKNVGAGPYLEDKSLVMNEPRQGRKVLSTLKLMLSKCSSFRFFVAFVNRDGVISLLESFRTLEAKGIKGEICF